MDTLKKIIMIEASLAQTKIWEEPEKIDGVVELDDQKPINGIMAWDGDEAMNEILNNQNWMDFGDGISTQSGQDNCFNPVDPIEIQKGFTDFAEDFWNAGILAEQS